MPAGNNVCAIQDVRGRFQSEGEWYAFAQEAQDGYDTVEWLGTQTWSTGKVGTMGDSYAGSDQSALATLAPPHLGTMIVAVGASNYNLTVTIYNYAMSPYDDWQRTAWGASLLITVSVLAFTLIARFVLRTRK